uniref:EGF-like domain-containing protein n=1 Tax=Poecilia mexicana TaxID=48701 RepID=A0A3B3Y8A4_9TELE
MHREVSHVILNILVLVYITAGLVVEHVCKNAGHCVNVGNSHQCKCQSGYTGSYCEEMVDECQSNPCRNGATCFQGVNCEYDVDECHSKPCLNGGRCINLINRFTCICPPGTHGRSKPLNCFRSPRCRNGGQCVDGVGRYTCSCPPGFVGEHCEGDVNECQSGPCSAAGSLDCIELVNDYQCLCRLGYTGTCILPAQTGGTQVERFSVVGVRASRKTLLIFLPFVADYFLTFSRLSTWLHVHLSPFSLLTNNTFPEICFYVTTSYLILLKSMIKNYNHIHLPLKNRCSNRGVPLYISVPDWSCRFYRSADSGAGDAGSQEET